MPLYVITYQRTQAPLLSQLQSNLYVDDWLTDSEHEVYIRATEALDILKTAGFPLTKWCSNGSFANARLQSCNDKISGSDVLKVLGLSWNASTDEFLVARLFDLLGLIFPFIITAKILFQDLWRKGLEWDVPLPVTELDRCEAWIKGLAVVRTLSIPRTYFAIPTSCGRILYAMRFMYFVMRHRRLKVPAHI